MALKVYQGGVESYDQKLARETAQKATANDDIFHGACTATKIEVKNKDSTAAYLKLFDGQAFVVGTDVPDTVLEIPAGGSPLDGSGNGTFVLAEAETGDEDESGMEFSTGFCMAVTTGADETDSTDPTNGVEVIVYAK